jgi:hypothetical protein
VSSAAMCGCSGRGSMFMRCPPVPCVPCGKAYWHEIAASLRSSQ